MRPEHWLKNILLFAPSFFAGSLVEPGVLREALVAFGSFSLSASGLYIINDISDIEADRRHPKKRNRPLASGEVARSGALSLSLLLFALGVGGGVILGMPFLRPLLLYILLGLLYSLGLKHVAPLDVFLVALGYLLRVIAGGGATGVRVSPWLFMSIFLLSLFISLAKRRAEIEDTPPSGRRPVLIHYSTRYLDISLGSCAAVSLLMYALYTVEKGGDLIYTVLPAAYGILRYLLLILEGEGAEPLETFLRDPQLWITTLLFLGGIGWLIYHP